MPYLGIYSWSQYTTPAALSADDLRSDTHPNDPAAPTHQPSEPSWIGEAFTFNGGGPTRISIDDDDTAFEDGYVETGGAQTLDAPVTIDGVTYSAGSVVENEFSLVNGSGQEIYVVRIDGENVGFTYADGEEPAAGESFTAASGRDGSPADNADGTSSSATPYSGVICYAAGTLIDTPFGARPVETLRPGDKVSVRGDAAQPVMWLGRTEIDLTRAPAGCRPVLIEAGSLGAGRPRRDLVVSQQHRMMLMSPEGEVFVPAKALLARPGVRIMQGRRRVDYVHLLLPRHHVIEAEGTPSESFYPGPTALALMQDATRGDLLAVLERILRGRGGDYGPLARPCLGAREGEALAAQLGALPCAIRDRVAPMRGASMAASVAAPYPAAAQDAASARLVEHASLTG